MGYKSPMMRRIQGYSLANLKVPRKGRIRIILVLLVVTVGFKMSGALFKSDDQPKNLSEKSIETVESSISKDKKTQLQSESGIEKPVPHALSFNDIYELEKNAAPDYRNCEDTLQYLKSSVVVHVSIDTSLQNLGHRLLQRYHPKYGAVVAIQPRTGRVLSLISYTRDSVPDLGKNLYCKSLFPAASIYKTITAAAAIEHANFNSQSMVKYAGRNHTLYKYQLEKELKQFREIPLEQAYAQSINPVFARIGMYTLGNSVLFQFGKKFGFNVTVPFELDNEPSNVQSPDSLYSIAEVASGFNQRTTISPLLGALIASAISENGRMPRPVLVDSINALNGERLYNAKPGTWRVPIGESTAKELREMMGCVSRYGTARKSFRYIKQSERFNEFEYGGKTGSIDKDGVGRVDWFIGFARHPKEVDQRIAIGVVTVHGAYWTVHSSFIAAEFFRVYLRSLQEQKEKIEQEKNVVQSDTSHSHPRAAM